MLPGLNLHDPWRLDVWFDPTLVGLGRMGRHVKAKQPTVSDCQFRVSWRVFPVALLLVRKVKLCCQKTLLKNIRWGPNYAMARQRSFARLPAETSGNARNFSSLCRRRSGCSSSSPSLTRRCSASGVTARFRAQSAAAHVAWKARHRRSDIASARRRLEAEVNGERRIALQVLAQLGFNHLMRLDDYVMDMKAVTYDYVLMGRSLKQEEEYAGLGGQGKSSHTCFCP